MDDITVFYSDLLLVRRLINICDQFKLAMGGKLPLDTENFLFRIKGGIQLEGVLNKTDEEGIKAGFKEAINELISKVNSQAFILSGHSGSLYMWPKTHASTHPSELQEDSHCKAILKYVTVEVSDSLKKASKKKSLKIIPLKVINLRILFETTRPDFVEKVLIQHNKLSRIHFKLTLPIDVAVFANPEDSWGKLQDQFVEAVTQQLSAMDKCIQRYAKGKSVPMPQAYHFELREKPSLTTVIYPAGISDETLQPQRKELHTELGLGDKPIFRRSMAYRFPSDELATKYLRNVHKYIPAPDPEEFKVYLVHGYYTFYHCLQDNENDIEWGAPYHCLQIVISWFNSQGYFDKPIPTVEELQEMLTKIDEEFVNVMGAREWFTAEQMTALLKLFNISSTNTEIRLSHGKEKSSGVKWRFIAYSCLSGRRVFKATITCIHALYRAVAGKETEFSDAQDSYNLSVLQTK
ncbi:ufm1-specific protease 2-like [Cetorhinus maximus]